MVDIIQPMARAGQPKAVIDEHRAKGTLDERIQTVMRGSSAGHCRRMMPKLLSAPRFPSNNAAWNPIFGAPELIVRLRGEGRAERRQPALRLPGSSPSAGAVSSPKARAG